MLVMRDGATQPGRFVNMIGGDTLWDNEPDSVSNAIRDVSRVYLNPGSARTAFNYTGARRRPSLQLRTGCRGMPVRVDAKSRGSIRASPSTRATT